MRIHHVALRVADVARALGFYAGVLGLQELERRGSSDGLAAAWLEAGEIVLMLEQRLRGQGAGAGSAHVLAFHIDDVAAWETRLAAAGVAIDDRTPHTIYVRDPDGHRVGLTTYRD